MGFDVPNKPVFVGWLVVGVVASPNKLEPVLCTGAADEEDAPKAVPVDGVDEAVGPPKRDDDPVGAVAALNNPVVPVVEAG